METNELTHHGIKGMRWGVRRYQNADGTLTDAGKKRYASDMDKLKQQEKTLKTKIKQKEKTDKNKQRTQAKLDKLEAKKKELKELKKSFNNSKKSKKPEDGKVQNKKVKEEKPEKTEEELYQERKQKAIKSGSAKDILQFKGDLTAQEMQEVSNRIRWEQDMRSLSIKDAEANDKVRKAFDKVDKYTNYAVTSMKAYNVVASIANAFGGTKSVSLPTIEIDSINKSNKETRRKEQKRLDDERKAAEAAKKKEKAAKKEEKINKKVDDDIEDRIKNSEKKSKESEDEKRTVYTGKVTGEGTSTYKKKDSGPIIDVDYRDVTPSSISSKKLTAGKSAIDSIDDVRPLSLPPGRLALGESTVNRLLLEG